jgi:ATP-dependent helicase/nuclease subunit A
MQKSYAINSQACSPAAYYAAACDPQGHIAIEACAGAGKTWILVSRILRALFAGAAPQSILAITFTKKAAGEMQQRLSEWLAEFASADDSKLQAELQSRGIAQLSAADIGKLRGLQAQLLHNPHTVQIRTFHGWFTALLQSAPQAVFQDLKLPYPFTPVESDTALIEQIWPAFYAAVAADPQLDAAYASLITDLGRHNTKDCLGKALSKRLEFKLADRAGSLDSSLAPLDTAFPDLAEYQGSMAAALGAGSRVHSSLQTALAEITPEKNKTHAEAHANLSAGLEQADWALCCKGLLTQAGTLKKALPDTAATRQAETLLLGLGDWQSYAHALVHQNRMLGLSRVLIQQYQEHKFQNGQIDMVDVEEAAQLLLTDSSLAAWMQEKLDAQVRHLLIDEFQDTSPLQWQILKSWLESYAGAGGGAEMPRLFIVGDPKQSIYRFRNAEPRVFIDAQAMVQHYGGALLSCEHTRRNAPAVIDAVNQVLGGAGMTGFRPHTTESSAGGQILAQVFDRPEKIAAADASVDAQHDWRDSLSAPRELDETPAQAAECEALAAWLAGQIQQLNLPASNFMVLARKRERLAQLHRHLAAHGLPALIAEKSQLPAHLEIQDLIALLDVLHSPDKNLALAQTLKSPIFGWSDAQLVELALAASKNELNWWQTLAHSSHVDGQAIHSQLLRWQGWASSLPVYDALFAIYGDGQLPARYAQAAPPAMRARISANLQGLLQAALDFKQGRFANSWQFVRALRDPKQAADFPAPALVQADAIQLLTVHGAKGLEANTVILLDTLGQNKAGDSYGVYSDWPAASPHPTRFVFLLNSKNTPRAVQDLLDAEKQAQAREELNALYVAMTRAQERLIFTATATATASGKAMPESAWWNLLQTHSKTERPLLQSENISANASEQAKENPALPANPQSAAHCQLLQLPQLPRLPESPESPALPETPAAASASNSLIARRGQALHRLLEWGIDAAPTNRAWHDRLMREFALDAATCDELLAQALTLRSGAGAWVWDASRISWAGNEVDIAHQGQLLRLDRLVQEAGTGCWWVVDYKSAFTPEHKPELHAQMQSYIAAVQAAWPDAPAVRGAWIAGDGRWVEYQNLMAH